MAPRSRRTARVCACGRALSRRAWLGLASVRVLGARDLSFVVGWPEDVTVDVRRCGCGREVSRLAARSP